MILYVVNGQKYSSNDIGNSYAYLFRRRFAVPWDMFTSIVIKFKEMNPNMVHTMLLVRPAAPIELLILASLRVLTRNWTFDDCSKATGISEEKHRTLFLRFIYWYATDIYPLR